MIHKINIHKKYDQNDWELWLAWRNNKAVAEFKK